MEIIRPATLDLEANLTTGGESPYSDFSGAATYWYGDRVYSAPPTGDGNNYQLRCWYYSSATRPEDASYCWTNLGTSYYETTSYTTDVTTSEYPAWSSGSAVVEGERRYYNRRDYEALVALTGGVNVIAPESAVASPDVDIASRWLDLGPSLAFRCLDDEASTVTTWTGSWTMELDGVGRADRIGFWAMKNVASISVAVTAGEIISNASFDSANVEWTKSASINYTHSTGKITVTTSSTNQYIYYEISGLTIGEDYTFSATTANVDGGEQWRVKVEPAGGGTAIETGSTQTTSTTSSVTWTATESTQRLVFDVLTTGASLDVTAVSCKQDSYVQDNIADTLEDATTHICIRNTIIPHDIVTNPHYAVTITAINESAETELGLVNCGSSITIGCTHSDVEVGGLSYSRLSENQYGDVLAIRRRRARQFRAIVQLESLDGDLLDQVLTDLEGINASFDFNRVGTTTISRLQVHGWAESWSTIVTGLSGTETLSISMRSLVEAVSSG